MDANNIIAENIIKIEEVKLEPHDHAGEQNWNFTDGGQPILLKTEPKEENDQEEELKPVLRVFLDPSEVPNVEVKQEPEDPLAEWNESFVGNSILSTGGDFSDLKMGVGNGFEKCNGTDLTLVKASVHLSESVEGSKNSEENASQIPRGNDLRPENEVCAGSLSRSRLEVGTAQKGAYVCPQCPKSFEIREHLGFHMRIHNGVRPKDHPFKCSVCPKSFAKSGGLTRHMWSHKVDQTFECAVCQEKFNQSGLLSSHMRSHKDRPHKCTVCQKTFNRKHDFDEHMLTHSGERPYKCNICRKGFIVRGHLLKHVRSHFDQSSTKCLKTQYDLLKYMQIHSGDLPYQCSVCLKSFSKRINFVGHVRGHKERPHTCTVCHKNFAETSVLDKHMLSHR